MVRPSHDLPALVVGGIKDYADQEGIDPETAHEKLLRQALAANNIGVNEGSHDGG